MNIPASAHTDLPTRCEPYLCLFALCYSPSSCPPLLKFKVTSCCSYLCLIIPVQIKVFLVLMMLTYLTLILITSFCAHCNIKVQIHMKCYFFGVVMCLLLSCCGVFFSFCSLFLLLFKISLRCTALYPLSFLVLDRANQSSASDNIHRFSPQVLCLGMSRKRLLNHSLQDFTNVSCAPRITVRLRSVYSTT